MKLLPEVAEIMTWLKETEKFPNKIKNNLVGGIIIIFRMR